jgi:ABC-type bacteriocin/lantibiotic exporter with double-glycine peptidase domain
MFFKFNKKLKIPYHKQENPYYCGPAVLQMVFEYFGCLKDQKYLAEFSKTSEAFGTSNLNMIKTVSEHGFYYYEKNNSNFVEVKSFLNMGLPVIVRFIVPELGNDPVYGSPYEHFAIIKKVNKKSLIFDDPTYWGGGKNFKISKEKFLKKWLCPQNNGERWIMVVSDKDLFFGGGNCQNQDS